MARGLNSVTLIGNLGADPEIKYTPSGTAIANFTMATAENRKNQSGEWEEYTEWHRIVAFGRTAEVCKDYLHKGSRIFVNGRLQTRSWEDNSGAKRYATEIVVNDLIMLDGADGGSSNDRDRGNQNRGGGSRRQSSSSTAAHENDDLPF